MNRFVTSLVASVILVGCSSTEPDTTAGPPEKSAQPASVSSATAVAESFPITRFSNISDRRVSEETAGKYEAVFHDMADGDGMTAVVMSPEGTWSGATGKANDARELSIRDQFGIASVTKSVVAAQVMLMVEDGELGLDDPVADYLPDGLNFDANGSTIRQLLSHRSGIPHDLAELDKRLLPHPGRLWTTAEVLKLVPSERSPAGEVFEYSNTNFQLLGLIIEHVRGRPIGDVLRDGVLNIRGVARLIYQPEEAPTEPMAMPGGQSMTKLMKGGGYLPFLATVSADGPAAAMASDAPSLARWWRRFCAGEIVSQDSLAEMTTLQEGYGLGLYNVASPLEQAVGHTGDSGFPGYEYAAWAGCLPDHGVVIVVLSNSEVANIDEMASPLIEAVTSG